MRGRAGPGAGNLAATFGGALALLTRLPAGALVRGGRAWPAPRDTVWAFPAVGAIVGAIGGAAILAAAALGLPRGAGAVLALAAMALATGGLHEDGLADTFDALGGGRDAAHRLAILRDSRIGAHGALALLLATLLRASLLAGPPPRDAAEALVLAAALGRWSMLIVIAGARPARPDGLGAAVAGGRGPLRAGLAGGLVLLPLAPAATVLAAIVGLAAMRRARTRFGGYTGDLLGATASLAECAGLAGSVALGG